MRLNLVTLDGHSISHKIESNILTTRSELHLKARELLQQEFPFLSILEEVYMPVLKKKKLPFDFFIPKNNLIIEVHGEQHFKYIPFYHKTKFDYLRSKVRDNDKKEWCKLNNFRLVEFLWNENIETWKMKL